MMIAALILSVLSLLISMVTITIVAVKHYSTHSIEILDPTQLMKETKILEKQDKKINKKIAEIEEDDEWI